MKKQNQTKPIVLGWDKQSTKELLQIASLYKKIIKLLEQHKKLMIRKVQIGKR